MTKCKTRKQLSYSRVDTGINSFIKKGRGRGQLNVTSRESPVVAVPSQECDSCFSVVPVVEMVELLIGFVGFCGLSHLNAPCTTV
jgi:hypothetical protein